MILSFALTNKNLDSKKQNIKNDTSNDNINTDAPNINVWNKSIAEIKKDLDPQIFKAWIEPLQAKESSDKNKTSFEILAKNKFCLDHVKSNYGTLINSAISKVTGEGQISVNFKVGELEEAKSSLTTKTKPSSARNDNSNSKIVVGKATSSYSAKPYSARRGLSASGIASQQTNLNPQYNFSNYVVGGCNQFSHAVSLRVAENLGAHYNPLFIYGGVGLGKTHLVNSIGNAAHRRGKKVLFVSSEYFVNELISCIRTKSTDKFKSRFRSLDLLIIDDIQFFSGKERTQEEFFHTFNDLHQKSKQIVITSDKLPHELTDIEERLRTRFASGLSADLQAPDFETRAAIIIKKANDAGIDLSRDVVSLFAERVDTNVRELEGALNKAQAISLTQERPINIELAEEVLRSCSLRITRDITPDLIQRTVAEKYNVSMDELLGKRRTQNIAFARHVAMHICRKMTACSFPEIGALFGGRDHSTVIHANRVIDQRKNADSKLDEDINRLISKIKG